jgi:nucleosome binding factor SPN SPT16 subunit
LYSLHEETNDKLEKANNIQPLFEFENLMRTADPIRLTNLKLRPALTTARGTVGILECHLNGLRYTSNRDDEIIIPFRYVKHFIYQ